MTSLLNRLADWLDDRTGYRQQLHEALYENIPGGARWRYVTGSMLAFAFVMQVITGVFLWMCYSPSSQTAWESVYYIQYEMQGGWLLRGVHHFMAQAMVVLLPIHLLQVLVDKAYQAPREINFWLGLVLMLLVLGLGLTGYLLPWDQKGFWATKVATNLMSLAPFGAYIQKLAVGSSEYGHHTLTRFFAMHAGVLPGLLVIFLFLHISMFRRHGITVARVGHRPDQFFWPHQVLKDGVACLMMLVLVLAAVIWVGAELGPPADPAEEYSAARPEWYYLSLFQLLKKFKSEFLGAIVIPGLVVAYLFAMPLIAKLRRGHALNLTAFVLLLVMGCYLTLEAMYQDNVSKWVAEKPTDPKAVEQYEASRQYHEAVDRAHDEYERTKELITYHGIPKAGAISMMRNDPEIQGPRLFRRHCASCHAYTDSQGQGISGPEPSETEPNGAPNLYRFASREWIRGFLDPEQIGNNHYFGNTAFADGTMVSEVVAEFSELDEEQQASLEDMVVAISAEATLPFQADADRQASEDGTLERGREVFGETLVSYACSDCHFFPDFEDGSDGPDLTGYGSYDWLKKFIADPEHFYWDTNDRMPSFAANDETPEENLLSQQDIDLLVRWIREDDRQLSEKISSNDPSTSSP